MTILVAYQSLNSNSSTTHNLAASTAQFHTRMAQKNLATLYGDDSGFLEYPSDPDVAPHKAIHGPPKLTSVADGKVLEADRVNKKRKRDNSVGDSSSQVAKAQKRTLSKVEGKARQIHQQAYRDLSATCDLIAVWRTGFVKSGLGVDCKCGG